MTSIDTWPIWIAIIVSGGPILLSAVTLAYTLYLGRCHMDAIKEALGNSRYIYIWGPSLGRRGLIWSILEVGKITGMIVWPKASIQNGELDPEDFQRFPYRLKRLLKAHMVLMMIAVVWQAIVFLLVTFR